MGSFWAVTNPDRPEYRLPAAVYAASKAAATMLTVQYAKAEPGITFDRVERDAGLGLGVLDGEHRGRCLGGGVDGGRQPVLGPVGVGDGPERAHRAGGGGSASGSGLRAL